MKVLVDTPIWSYALRANRGDYQLEIDRLKSLINDQRALILGPIRQEILSGYSDLGKFNQLKEKLSFFQNTPIQDSDYEWAAEFSNTCRKKGVQGSHIDFLICAVSKRMEAPLFTTDKDFLRYQKAISIKLF
ncbi:MAG: PIN domain-containing protein [Proteobacteria bacterium]|nr:PIN domain-containing protein [Pseudomonadota bacterium]MBU4472374.1 PIN domain-containing protein [Pseudomonadota bacterium]MCG2752069.1 PIN domain-containing protein [Desulfobacteraceae bacterium]